MRTTPMLIVATLLSLGSAAPAFAGSGKPGADWMPIEQVRQRLSEAGYTSIKKIKADDGHWEGEGVKNGVKMEFHVNPKTGAITKEEPDDD